MYISSPTANGKQVEAVTKDRYVSSDEESWTTVRAPLLNTLSWGWTEDGRCKSKRQHCMTYMTSRLYSCMRCFVF